LWSLLSQIAESGLDTDWSNKSSFEKYSGGVHSRNAPLNLLPRLVCWTKAMLGFLLLFLMGLLSRCCLMRPRESRLFLSPTYFNKHDADIPLVSHFLPLLTTCPRPSPLSIYPKFIMYYHTIYYRYGLLHYHSLRKIYYTSYTLPAVSSEGSVWHQAYPLLPNTALQAGTRHLLAPRLELRGFARMFSCMIRDSTTFCDNAFS